MAQPPEAESGVAAGVAQKHLKAHDDSAAHWKRSSIAVEISHNGLVSIEKAKMKEEGRGIQAREENSLLY